MVVGAGIHPNYFLDEMTPKEASYIIKNVEDKYVNEWNQTRFIAYIVMQSQSTKKLTPTDILRFPWETDEVEKTTLTKETKEKLKQHALEMEKKINN